MKKPKKRNLIVHCAFALAVIHAFLVSPCRGADNGTKRALNNNMTEIYHMPPETAGGFLDIFNKGMFYGRIRMNSFYYEYENGALHDPTGFGLGGSLLYKTAPFQGVSATVGIYTSQNFGLLNREDAYYGRTGKDTFSRYERLANGDWGMTPLAQAYGQYHLYQTEIRIGRQIFESFITASNDTKMIPNTFEGATMVSHDIPDTTLVLGYLWKGKNRDHESFHDVITYGDGRGNPYSKWNNQDDSAAHRGLSYANLRAGGKHAHNHLIVADLTNKTIPALKLDLGYAAVPDLFYTVKAETNYRFSLPGGATLTPGFRYMQQIDRGAGRVGGAALSGTLVNGGAVGDGGYEDPNSADGRLYATRLVFRKGAAKISVGYSRVSDDADIIAPWRGFPTRGYTRPMAHYNWYANTRSCMVQIYFDFEKAGVIDGFRANLDLIYTDYDDQKERLGGLKKTDQRYVHLDMWYTFSFFPGLEAKVRLGYADADDLTNSKAVAAADGKEASFREVRFELNYLF